MLLFAALRPTQTSAKGHPGFFPLEKTAGV
jgi:hypothetical protein